MILVALDSITMINIKERKDQNATQNRDEDMSREKILEEEKWTLEVNNKNHFRIKYTL